MSVFSAPSFDQHELLVFHNDASSKLRAIIAIHNTVLGPATGGCRMFDYVSDEAALNDVLRLSRGMTYKSALADLPLGGGKAVIMGDPAKHKSRDLLLAMGEFIESLGGRYVCAEDSGTTVADMSVIHEKTQHVSGLAKKRRFGGDPSPYTAYGVYCGMQAALLHQRGKDSLKGVRVAIQGVGAVGRHLAARLIQEDAVVYVADVSAANLKRAEALGSKPVPANRVLSMDVDIVAPCAMGGVINEESVEKVRAAIVAGAANNQLESAEQGDTLRKRGILYAPDFVINAGGIIDVYYQQCSGSAKACERHVERISAVLANIFQQSEHEQRSTHAVAEVMAEALFLHQPTPPRGAVVA